MNGARSLTTGETITLADGRRLGVRLLDAGVGDRLGVDQRLRLHDRLGDHHGCLHDRLGGDQWCRLHLGLGHDHRRLGRRCGVGRRSRLVPRLRLVSRPQVDAGRMVAQREQIDGRDGLLGDVLQQLLRGHLDRQLDGVAVDGGIAVEEAGQRHHITHLHRAALELCGREDAEVHEACADGGVTVTLGEVDPTACHEESQPRVGPHMGRARVSLRAELGDEAPDGVVAAEVLQLSAHRPSPPVIRSRRRSVFGQGIGARAVQLEEFPRNPQVAHAVRR